MDTFAVTGAVSYSTGGGHFEFYNTTLTRNYAIANPLALITEGFTASVINYCRIYDNKAFTVESVNDQLINEN